MLPRRHTDELLLFFFSSRRRHTRFDCDWSSDVCSSDLATIRSRLDFISAVCRHNHPTVREFNIRRRHRINLFDRRRKTRQSMRRGQIVGNSGSWASGERQRKPQISLAHNPNTRCSFRRLPKELKPRNRTQRRHGGKRRYAFLLQRVYDRRVRVRQFTEEAGRLLPLALARNVRIVSASKSKDRKQMPLGVVVMQQVIPSLVIKRGDVSERRWPELRMQREKTDDLRRVEITDDALASAPVVTVAVFGNEGLPQTHLRNQRWPHAIENVFAAGHLGGFPDVASVLVGITIVTSGRRRIVGVDYAVAELNRSAIE